MTATGGPDQANDYTPKEKIYEIKFDKEIFLVIFF